MEILILLALILAVAYAIGWARWWGVYVEELMSLEVDEAEAMRMATRYRWTYIGKDALAHADRDYAVRETRA